MAFCHSRFRFFRLAALLTWLKKFTQKNISFIYSLMPFREEFFQMKWKRKDISRSWISAGLIFTVYALRFSLFFSGSVYQKKIRNEHNFESSFKVDSRYTFFLCQFENTQLFQNTLILPIFSGQSK